MRDTAREHEPDRYLAALLAPRTVRRDLIALAGFLGSLRRLPSAVKDPMMGEIRLQWWRDALEMSERGETTGNPVADEFGAAVRRHALPHPDLLGMIEARAFDLYPDPMPDGQVLKAYLARTEGAGFALALRIARVPDTGAAAEAAAAAGQAYGMVRLLAELPRFIAKGGMPLPATHLAAAGLGEQDLLAEPLPEAGQQIISGLCNEARDAAAMVRRLWPGLPGPARSVLLPVALVEPYFRALQSPGHNPVRQLAAIVPLVRVWRIWRMHWIGR